MSSHVQLSFCGWKTLLFCNHPLPIDNLSVLPFAVIPELCKVGWIDPFKDNYSTVPYSVHDDYLRAFHALYVHIQRCLCLWACVQITNIRIYTVLTLFASELFQEIR